MTDSPSAPKQSRTPRRAPWWRLGGLTLDTILLLLVVQSWNLPVLDVARTWFSSGSPAAEGVRFSSRGFNLLGVEGEVLGLAFTALVLAIQIPFLLRGSTVGMTFCGVELRVGEQRAAVPTTLAWVGLAWVLSLIGAYGGVILLMAAGVDSGGTALGLLGATLFALPLTNLIVGLRSGHSVLDRLLGVHIGGRQAAPPAGDHLGGWKPRANPPRIWSSTVDDDAKLWRQHSSPDPLAPFLGPAVAPAPEAPMEPEHAVHMSADDPYAAVGGVADNHEEEAALLQRLRGSADDPDGVEAG